MTPQKAPAARAPVDVRSDELSNIELTEVLLAELLDGWDQMLSTYAQSMSMAVALTDAHGGQLGPCHNPQPIWTLVQSAPVNGGAHCPFCLVPAQPCRAVEECLATGLVVTAHDPAGFAHVAAPLILGGRPIGAILAGQVFDRYPEPLPLLRAARALAVSPQELWRMAVRSVPKSRASLRVFGELLTCLGNAFLRERYAVILERQLAQTSRRYQLLVDGVEDYALFTVDGGGIVTSWNRGAERLLGYTEPEIKGKDFCAIFSAEDNQAGAPKKALQRAALGGWTSDEGWQVRKDGTRFYASGVLAALGSGEVREFGRLMRDTTDQRTSEEAIRQAQKLESIGVLASGIAHDFNNLLAGILFSVSCAKESLPPESEAHSLLEIAEQSTEKAGMLTSQLLAYAGKGKFIISRFDLSSLIAEVLPFIETAISKKVILSLSFAPEPLWIEADASQIQQVIMNLVINGSESIAAHTGTLRVATGRAELAETPDSQGGAYIYMEIQDSGCGMDAATRQRIFDPFFTTKVAGRGLGLAAVSGIVRGHKGRLEVASAPGQGTTFKVFFPEVAAPASAAAVTPSRRATGSEGKILVADDESLLRELARMILERNGYSAMLAPDGQAAVNLFRAAPDQFAAVLLDLTMAVMGGEEAFRQIRAIRPNVPILISSGYGALVVREQFESGPMPLFIQKPYSASKLIEHVRFAIQNVSGL